MKTPEQRMQAIQARVEATPAGPWMTHSQQWDEWICPVAPVMSPMIETEDTQIAKFIAASRSDIPWLLDQLRAAIERERIMEEAVTKYVEKDPCNCCDRGYDEYPCTCMDEPFMADFERCSEALTKVRAMRAEKESGG